MNQVNSLSIEIWDHVSEKYTFDIGEDEKQLFFEIKSLLLSIGVKPGASLVELGCGSGHLSVLLAESGYQVTLVDFSPKALDHARQLFTLRGQLATFIEDDLQKIDITKYDHYDVAWNSGVMEHFDDAGLYLVLNQTKRISFDKMIVIVPNCSSVPYLLFRQDMMMRGQWIWGKEYLRADYPEFFLKAGLIPVSKNYLGGKTARYFIDDITRKLYGKQGFNLEELISYGIVNDCEKYLSAYILKRAENETAVLTENQQLGCTETNTDRFDLLMSESRSWMKSMEKEKTMNEKSEISLHSRSNGSGEQDTNWLNAENSRLKILTETQSQDIILKENQLDDARSENEELVRKISEIKSQLELKNLTIRKHVTDKSDLVNRINEVNNTLSAMSATKPYQISNLLRRFSHEFIHGNISKRKTFVKWIGKKILRKTGPASNPYNLIYQICEENQSLVNRVTGTGNRFSLDQGNIDYNVLSDFEQHLYNDILTILKAYPDPYVLLYPTAIDWDIDLYQRPQHLARCIAESGYMTLFITCNHLDKIDTVQTVSPDCHIVNANNHIELLVRLIKQTGKKIILKIDSTDNIHGYSFVKMFEQSVDKIVYEYIDEIHEKISGREIPLSTWERHHYLLENRNVVVIATADRLFQEVQNVRGPINCALVTNGADVDHFRVETIRSNPPSIIKSIAQKQKPIIGYYGALADWFDYDLIRLAAQDRPEYEFVLIGPVLNTKLDKSQFSHCQNVHFLGAVNYRQLPTVASYFDVAMIPFKINEITLSTSPIKLFEYMAMGKPIVTTDMPECRKYESVLIATDSDGFIRQIDTALQKKADKSYLESLSQEADKNSWQHKAYDLLRTVNQSMRPKMPILFLSIIDWNFRYQRPQHIAKNLAKNGHDVYFINANFSSQLKQDVICDHLKVVTLNGGDQSSIHLVNQMEQTEPLLSDILSLLSDRNLSELIIIVEYPTWEPIASKLQKEYGAHVVFDYLDEFDGFSQTNANRFLGSTASALRKSSDLVIATSSYLFSKVSEDNTNCITIRNGTEFIHFNTAATVNRATHTDHAKSKRPVIGYYGAIADWFADKLVADVAKSLPNYDFVLIGDYKHGNVTALKKLSNVRLLGEMPYDILPNYLADFDVCLIPFNADLDLIKATNPVKFYEYLSAGKKVVATEIPELAVYRDQYVLMSNDPSRFAEMVKSCVEGTDSLLSENELVKFARQHDWAERAQSIEDAINGLFPKTSIVVVTYNNIAYTKMCIDSIVNKTTYPNYEIIVVDNASSDETPQYLQIQKSIHESMIVSLNKENSGFAKGNNIGIRQATGETIILLNNDTIVTPGWIQCLRKHLIQDGIGMVGPVTNNIANEAKISVEYTDMKDIDPFSVRQYYCKLGHHFDIRVLAMYCVAISKKILNQIGLLDESFGIGMFEDDDYSDRIRKAGYRVVCCEDAFIHHFGGATFKLIGQDQYMELFNKNKKIYEAKHNTKFKQHQTRE